MDVWRLQQRGPWDLGLYAVQAAGALQHAEPAGIAADGADAAAYVDAGIAASTERTAQEGC